MKGVISPLLFQFHAEMAEWHTRPPQKQLFAGSSPALRTISGPLSLWAARLTLRPSGHPPLHPSNFRPLVQRSEQRAHNPPDAGSNPAGPTNLNNMHNPSDPIDAPAPEPPAGDNAWLQSLLFPDGSQLIDYGDGTLIVEGPGA